MQIWIPCYITPESLNQGQLIKQPSPQHMPEFNESDINEFLQEFNDELLTQNIVTTMKSLSNMENLKTLPYDLLETYYNLSIISLCIDFKSECDNKKKKQDVINVIAGL